MGAHEAGTTPGLDLARLRPWFAETVPTARVGTLTATLITGGKSNLTYRLADGESHWILRRPPLGHVLATAHDMGREYAVMAALADTPVPVPRLHGLCLDTGILGAEFYVMEAVEGRPYRTAAELAPLGPARVRRISGALVDTLADLHTVDLDAVGLGGFGRPEGFLSRQVARWRKQMTASYSRDLPAAITLHAELDSRAHQMDATARPGIVHGDFRLDNALVDGDDRLRAVIDWEMATVGDPVTDLALMLLYTRLARLVGPELAPDAGDAPGFLNESEITARYAARSGRDLGTLGFHLGLAAFKLAAILEGIHFRHLGGQTVGPGFDRIDEAIHPLLDIGLAALKEH